MNGRSIYRRKTFSSYINEEQRLVLPKFVSPRTFLFLWILLGLLVAIGVLVCLIKIPLYTSGRGVVFVSSTTTSAPDNPECIVAFFPPDALLFLQIGRNMSVKFSERRQWFSLKIAAVEAKVLESSEMHQVYGLKTGKNFLSGPVAMVSNCANENQAIFSPPNVPLAKKIEAKVEIGSRRLITFFPFWDRFFYNQAALDNSSLD